MQSGALLNIRQGIPPEEKFVAGQRILRTRHVGENLSRGENLSEKRAVGRAYTAVIKLTIRYKFNQTSYTVVSKVGAAWAENTLRSSKLGTDNVYLSAPIVAKK